MVFYTDITSMQSDLDEWLVYYNTERTHQGKMCCGRTPLETLQDGKQIWQEKLVNWTWPDNTGFQKTGNCQIKSPACWKTTFFPATHEHLNRIPLIRIYSIFGLDRCNHSPSAIRDRLIGDLHQYTRQFAEKNSQCRYPLEILRQRYQVELNLGIR